MEIKIHRTSLERHGDGCPAPTKKPTSVAIIASFASAAALYDVGFSHFWHAPSADHDGDLIFPRPPVPSVVYSVPSCLCLSEEQMDNFRQETDGKGIFLPTPLVDADFEKPTVSMGLYPIQAIYQARFMKYLPAVGLIDAAKAEKRGRFGPSFGDGELTKLNHSARSAWPAVKSWTTFLSSTATRSVRWPCSRQWQDHSGTRRRIRGSGWNVMLWFGAPIGMHCSTATY